MNRRKMVKWLAAAGSFGALAGCSGELVPYAAERPIEISAAEQVILQDREAGRRFFMESVSAADREGRQEITVTGRESAFDTLVIAQMFPDVINISKTDLGTRSVNCFRTAGSVLSGGDGRRIPEKRKCPEQEISSGMKKTGRPGRSAM